MDISVIVPLYNEEESLPELAAWIKKVMDEHQFSYEVLMVDDGSTDKSWSIVESLHNDNPCIRGIRFRRNYGKSAALNTGFEACEGDVVITMDADLQDSPDEIPELYRMIKEDGYDLVSGWKKVRYDSKLAKNIPSKFFNWTTRKMSGIQLHDFNCGLKAYRKDVVKSIEVYSEMHRYIPLIAKWAGFNKIGEKVVVHQKRKYGVTKFGLNRFVNGYLDLLTITFTTRFGKKPMHAFGVWGSIAFLVGLVCAVWLIVAKLVHQSHGVPFRQVTDQPLFFLALLAMVLGFMLFLAGFLGEMIARNDPDRNKYQIAKKI
ncbi:MAG: glycosyltransferase [Bacteroidales bacterium]|jgi:glycosyltransferase involved in cell wall biosynthesis|nr:glycosyltransferase [Bacteroidales bacterium]MBR6132467.1 glycosyltransferase [Bacteroidales bacterium]MCR5551033.1 glycosyltransferase [Bacteroidales bacterium]